MITDEDYQRLGLTPLQANVLLALLELGGEASAPDIITHLSTKQKVNRTSIYSVLSKLEQMNLLISTNTSPTTYGLISTSPKMLMEEILKPQLQIRENFISQLQKAKAAQSRNLDYELFYLKNKEQILEQSKLIIAEADEYLLIMANALMLVELEESLQTRMQHDPLPVLLIPTWNPDESIDFEVMIQRYRELLGADHVVDTLPIFRRVLPMMMKVVKQLAPELQPFVSQTYFVQLLSQQQMLMATYIGKEENIGSGFYSKEPFISMMLHLIYVSLFEEFGDIAETVTNSVLSNKIQQSMRTIQHLFED